MLNLGFNELLVIIVLTIVVVGPEDIPKVLRELGKQYAKIARASEELRRAFMMEADRADAEARAEELRKRREEARKRAEEARARAAAARAAGQPAEEQAVPRSGGPTDPPPTPEAMAALAEAAGVGPDPAPVAEPRPEPAPPSETAATEAP